MAAIWMIVAAAAALRLYNLNWNSLNSDEAFSWSISNKPLLQLLSDSFFLRQDPHPPVYWLVLRTWQALAGSSEVALRWPSAMAGTIYVALIYVLGRMLFSRMAALAAAAFSTLSAFFVWNSQDARMYTLGGTLALAGLVCLIGGLRTGRRHWLAAYFVFTALESYTHIAGSFLLPFEGLAILLYLALARNAQQRRAGRGALLAIAAVGLVYAPYALNAWRASAVASIIRHTPAYLELVAAVMQRATLNTELHRDWWWFGTVLVGGCFVLGSAGAREDRRLPRGFARAFVLLFLFVTLAVIAVLSVRQSVFEPKTITFYGAAVALGVGAGWARLWQWHKPVASAAGLALFAALIYGLSFVWRPGFQKEDWRHAAAYVAAHAGPHDAVVVHLEYYRVPFSYYFRGRALTPFGSHVNSTDEVGRGFAPLLGSDNIWLVQSGEFLTDPDKLVQNWLALRYGLGTEQFPQSIAVRQYVVQPAAASLPAAARPLSIEFDSGLQLVGSQLDAQQLSASEQWLHPPSNYLHVRLYWSSTRALLAEPVVQVMLEDEPGNQWGALLQRPGTVRAFYPLARLPAGTLLRDELDLIVNPLAKPGTHKVVLRVTNADGSALLANGQSYVILGEVLILP